MWSSGYYYRADPEQGRSNVSFDAGVAAIFTQTCCSSVHDRHPVEAELQYVGIIHEILKVEYGHIPFILLKCSWIKPHLEGAPTIRVDEDGFWSVKYNARQTLAYEPYLFPKNAKQVSLSGVVHSMVLHYAFVVTILGRTRWPCGMW